MQTASKLQLTFRVANYDIWLSIDSVRHGRACPDQETKRQRHALMAKQLSALVPDRRGLEKSRNWKNQQNLISE